MPGRAVPPCEGTVGATLLDRADCFGYRCIERRLHVERFPTV